MSKVSLKEFINTCFHIFQQYEYKVVKNSQNDIPWHLEFVKEEKKYVVFCFPEKMNEEKIQQDDIVDFLSRATRDNFRAVVICESCEESEKRIAEDFGYCLLDIEVIQDFYEEMAHALEREYENDFLIP